jgi:thiol:disulfide interchange protein
MRRGMVLAFVGGVVLNLLPGVFPLVALKDIAQLDYGPAGTVAIVTGFYVVMFTAVEAPLVGFLVAPASTTRTVDTFNRWLKANAQRLIIVALEVAAIYLIARGIVAVA